MHSIRAAAAAAAAVVVLRETARSGDSAVDVEVAVRPTSVSRSVCVLFIATDVFWAAPCHAIFAGRRRSLICWSL